MTARLTHDDTEIHIEGETYTSVLEQIHVRAEPRAYLEIGTLHGDTLRLSRCRSVAVDPNFQLRDAAGIDPARIILRELTSDDYFARHKPRRDLGRKIDFAFLDGMHEFPFLLRDFINTEKHCTRNAIVAMHDCIPLDAHMTRLYRDVAVEKPSNHPDYWTGDVWKMVPVLRKYRTDLEVRCLDAPPTGLTICRGLNPKNTVLSDRYDEILAEWEHLTLDTFGMAALFDVARIESTTAWTTEIRPFHPKPLQWLGSMVQPRRRLQKAMTAMGLAAR